MRTPNHVTPENFGRVPRVYIECFRDHAIPRRPQKKMYIESPCEKVLALDTDHSPFFCATDDLAKQLLSLA